MRVSILSSIVLLCIPTLPALSISIETVTIGNPGNPGEQSRLQHADPTFYGGVEHTYRIGKYEVTAAEYAAFLNAVAATDPYALYNPNMGTNADGCGIVRSGSPGSYTYSVAPDRADRPVNYVNWGDAARFANWLHNGQPVGPQGPATTEDGSYFVNGAMLDGQLDDIVRSPGATWVIPTENEWYKAAYHKNDGVTANYWNFPTRSDVGPSNTLVDPDPGRNATFAVGAALTIGAPYYRTEKGAHENSASPYGTFDQAGNVHEFNETVLEHHIRGVRGGSYSWNNSMAVWDRYNDFYVSDHFRDLGFRVALVSDPGVTNLLAFDAAGTYFEWDPAPGSADVVYDIVRGDLSALSGNADGVDLGPLTCIEDDSPDPSNQGLPDTDPVPAASGFFYLVRSQDGPEVGTWGFGSEGGGRAGSGGCPVF